MKLCRADHKVILSVIRAGWRRRLSAACTLACLLSLPVPGQQSDPKTPVVVQPGAPGQPTRTLPSSTRATLLPASPADVQFMQHMIMHHEQAVEMTELIESHTDNQEIRTLGNRISRSQSDEMKFMKRLLASKSPLSFNRFTFAMFAARRVTNDSLILT